ncbi:MAG TPA: ParB/RepB/Spo0J family partition protein [Blastocatellia bacterium]|nr:ParB/RepB/Spo0J family partition protein [Blastocatellia bacterium]
MKQKHDAKQKADATAGVSKFRMIPLDQIAADPRNTRRHFSRAKLRELAADIRRQGLLQPVIVREIKPATEGGAKYQIVAGERRYRAAKEAGLKEIPAGIRSLDETEALSVQLVENLQREELHPLDEADGFLRMKEEMKLDIRAIAQRVAKDARYVARRLALTNLIEEAREDYRKDLITLAHALEICRLAPEIQQEALAACYETKSVFNETTQDYDRLPDKERPAWHVRYLQEWIAQNVHLNLQQAPFKPDDARLREDGLACTDCPQRSGFNKTLFADISEKDTCLNPPCFQNKLRTFVQLTKSELEKKHDKPVVFISTHYHTGSTEETVIARDQYQLLDKRADRCEFAEQAIQADGTDIGRVKWICREETCKDHLGRVPDSHSRSSARSGSHSAAPEDRNQRKQELFDLKVDEVVRKRVMKEAVKTFAWPLERRHLDEAVKEFFRRIPSDDQRTICEVFGWDDDKADRLHLDDEAVRQRLSELDDHRLAQFLMLCSFAHYGANPQRHRQVNQTAVVQLGEDRGVNHALIDAEVRLELCPKKYKATHQAYLTAVKNGRAAEKPLVCERPQKPAQPMSGVKTGRKAA